VGRRYVAAIRAGSVGFESAIVEKDKRLGRHLYLARLHPDQTTAAVGARVRTDAARGLILGVQASGIQLLLRTLQKRKDKVVMKNSKRPSSS